VIKIGLYPLFALHFFLFFLLYTFSLSFSFNVICNLVVSDMLRAMKLLITRYAIIPVELPNSFPWRNIINVGLLY